MSSPIESEITAVMQTYVASKWDESFGTTPFHSEKVLFPSQDPSRSRSLRARVWWEVGRRSEHVSDPLFSHGVALSLGWRRDHGRLASRTTLTVMTPDSQFYFSQKGQLIGAIFDQMREINIGKVIATRSMVRFDPQGNVTSLWMEGENGEFFPDPGNLLYRGGYVNLVDEVGRNIRIDFTDLDKLKTAVRNGERIHAHVQEPHRKAHRGFRTVERDLILNAAMVEEALEESAQNAQLSVQALYARRIHGNWVAELGYRALRNASDLGSNTKAHLSDGKGWRPHKLHAREFPNREFIGVTYIAPRTIQEVSLETVRDIVTRRFSP